jgi:hypothetical protein
LVNGILGQVVNNIEEWDKKKRMWYNRDKTIFK